MRWPGTSRMTSIRIRWARQGWQAGVPADIWPTQKEVADTVASCIDSTMFRTQYATVSDGDANWQNLKFPSGETYGWEPDSTYIRKAPYFDGMPATPAAVGH
jgi:aconitate hydratase